MIHPLLHVLTTQPHLIANHVEAYAELVSDEVGKASAGWIRRIALYAGAAVLGLMAVIFTGVAVMVWGGASSIDMNAPWLLIAVPVVFFVLTGICAVLAMAKPEHTGLQKVKEQFDADMSMLREVGSRA